MKSAPARQAEFEGGKRLISGVSEVVDGIYADRGLRRRNELNVNLLFIYGVARAQSGSTSGEPTCERNKREEQKGAGMVDREQDSSDCKSDEAAVAKRRVARPVKRVG
jgi:hypothetical protein